MKTIYCISGLGADERAFSRLGLKGYTIKVLPWLMPIPKEKIKEYATRMSKGIEEENPILLGLSFGGMMAIEIAKLRPVKKVILISSIKSISELPPWMRRMGKLQLNKLLPMRSFRILEPIQNRRLGISTREEIEMVRSYRKNAPLPYMNWAINEVLNWRNEWQPTSVYHIHGDADKIFPIQHISPSHIIKGGGHFMIMNRSAEVSAVLQEILEDNA